MVRTRDGGHVAVSWDDAYAEVERVLRPVLDRHGATAVTVYVGNPVAHNLGLSHLHRRAHRDGPGGGHAAPTTHPGPSTSGH